MLRETETIEYAAALIPDEDDEKTVTPVVEALVSDPAGYPVLLYEGAADSAPGQRCAMLHQPTILCAQCWSRNRLYEGTIIAQGVA